MNIAQLLGLATAGAMVAAEVSRKKQNKSAPKKKTRFLRRPERCVDDSTAAQEGSLFFILTTHTGTVYAFLSSLQFTRCCGCLVVTLNADRKPS